MPWYSVTLSAEAHSAEALSEALMDAGALSVSIEDADAGTDQERPQFGEPGMNHAPSLWSHSKVLALFDMDCDIATALAQAAAAAGLDGVPPFEMEEIADQNWVQLTQSQFDPIQINDGLWIVPSWHAAPNPEALNIEMDPGMAFGTGSHPTTKLCLQWVCDNTVAGNSFLDYGCGSGILAIVGAKLGATTVLGVDIDDQAVIASENNAERNGVAEMTQWRNSADAINQRFDRVVANILTNPLCVLAPAIAGSVAPGGQLALSGVLAEQADRVISAYAPYIALKVGAEHEGWIRLEGSLPC